MANIIARFKTLSKPKKVLIVVGIIGVLSISTYLVFKPKKVLAPAGIPEQPAVAGQPSLSVSNTNNEPDDYTVAFGKGIFYYTKGDAPVMKDLDSTWSIRMETSQDNLNYFQVTVLQDGNIVFTKRYL